MARMKTPSLCICFLISAFTAVQASNLALSGRATQSELVELPYSAYGYAQNAIDGNRDPAYEHGSCSHTVEQSYPWWRVDLLKEYIITSVIITNRRYYSWRIEGAEIRIGNSLENNGNQNPRAAVIDSIPGGSSRTFHFGDVFKGRYVNVFLPGENKILTLCEVEVYGYLAPTGENVALRGKATQSDLFEYGFAYNAIDGNRDSVWADGSCSRTKRKLNSWWRVDLLQVYKVFSVTITNTQDAAPNQLNGAEIRTGNTKGLSNPRCAVIPSILPGETQTFHCNGMEGRYVTVVIPGREEYLSLCEVEVYGSPLD